MSRKIEELKRYYRPISEQLNIPWEELETIIEVAYQVTQEEEEPDIEELITDVPLYDKGVYITHGKFAEGVNYILTSDKIQFTGRSLSEILETLDDKLDGDFWTEYWTNNVTDNFGAELAVTKIDLVDERKEGDDVVCGKAVFDGNHIPDCVGVYIQLGLGDSRHLSVYRRSHSNKGYVKIHNDQSDFGNTVFIDQEVLKAAEYLGVIKVERPMFRETECRTEYRKK